MDAADFSERILHLLVARAEGRSLLDVDHGAIDKFAITELDRLDLLQALETLAPHDVDLDLMTSLSTLGDAAHYLETFAAHRGVSATVLIAALGAATEVHATAHDDHSSADR
jgi:hypothetical protein